MNENIGTKRKKKSFIQKTVKYYKKGIHGKGVHIDEDMFEYFLHILKVLNQEFDSDEDKRAFVENVFEHLDGNEIKYSSNQVVSRIVDNLLPFASEEKVIKFMNAFGENMRPICMDPFASFVFQKLISTVTDRFLNGEQEKVDEDTSFFKEWLLKTFKYVLNNKEEFIFDNYANHIMRTVVSCIVGETKSNKEESRPLDSEFKVVLKNFVDQLLEWPQLPELPFQNISSGFLQILLQAIGKFNSKRTKLLCRKLMDLCYANEYNNETEEKKDVNFTSETPAFFENEPCVRLLEVILSVAPEKIYTQVYAKCFINRLAALAQHREANFAVQKLIKYSREKTEFEAIFDELSNLFESIMQQGNSGVILSLCEACVRLKTKQSVFLQMWMNYLNCNEPKDFQISLSPLTIFMKKREYYDENTDKNVHLHGSLLIQNMLKFNKPIKIINSILEMKSDTLNAVFCSPKGSHIADAFFESEFVGEKSKDKFIKALQGSYVSLATSKHGSRVFDVVWRNCNVKNRSMIASELLENESKLDANQFGRPIIFNISLAAFRHNKEDWMKAQSGSDKMKKLFADIVK